tara:strand:- start:8864 stop:10003 length:1140 start_codon:yes stop_codon:yes gene_type:complete
MSAINGYIKVGSLVVILVTLGILYRRYDDKLEDETKSRNDKAVRDYLLTDPDTLGPLNVTKPILWIPITYEYNSRDWKSFGSRSSYNLNQPYLYLTVKSIIKYCKDSFHICLVDDKSYKRLMPDFKYGDKIHAAPISDHIRKYAILRLLRTYGGMVVPPGFVCMRDLKDMHENALKKRKDLYFGENLNKTTRTKVHGEFMPDLEIMGCKRETEAITHLEKEVGELILKDFTNDMDITGRINELCNKLVIENHAGLVNGKLIGVRDQEDNKILLDDLMSTSYINLSSHCYGIMIPSDEILKRSQFQWFARQSGEQVIAGDSIISKYILVSTSPDEKKVIDSDDTEKPEWISYWEVPSKAPVWGPKPNYLGNNVLSVKSLE